MEDARNLFQGRLGIKNKRPSLVGLISSPDAFHAAFRACGRGIWRAGNPWLRGHLKFADPDMEITYIWRDGCPGDINLTQGRISAFNSLFNNCRIHGRMQTPKLECRDAGRGAGWAEMREVHMEGSPCSERMPIHAPCGDASTSRPGGCHWSLLMRMVSRHRSSSNSWRSVWMRASSTMRLTISASGKAA